MIEEKIETNSPEASQTILKKFNDFNIPLLGFIVIFLLGLFGQLIFHSPSPQGTLQPQYASIPVKQPEDILKQQSKVELEKLSQRVFTLFAIGGMTVDTKLGQQYPTASVEYYNPKINTWREAPPLQTPRSNAAATVLEDKIYVLGGSDPLFSHVLSSVEAFDPQSKTWSNKKDMPDAREGASAISIYGKIYIVGGQDTSSHPATRVLIYDPQKDAWSEGKDMPGSVVYERNCTGVETRIYCPEAGAHGVTLMYTPTTDAWTTTPTDGRSQVNYGKGDVYGNKLYSIVGSPYGNYLSIYDTSTDSIKRDITIQKIRWEFAVTSYTSYLFSLGGRWDNDPYTEVYGYNIYGYPQNTWFTLPSMIHPRANAAAVVLPFYFGLDQKGFSSISGTLHYGTSDLMQKNGGSNVAAFVPVLLETNDQTVNNDIARVESDANGNYTFSDLAPGSYTVLVEDPPGSSDMRLLANDKSQGQQIDLQQGENFTDLNYDFTYPPTKSIRRL